MVGGIQHGSEINHFHGTGNNAGFASESGKPVTLRHIVALNQMRLGFRLYEKA